MKSRQIIKNKVLNLLFVMALIVTQVISAAPTMAKAETVNPAINVIVETNSSKIVDASTSKTNAYEALTDVLNSKGIKYDIQDRQYGKYINSIDNVAGTKDFTKYWMYAVNRGGSYVDINSSLDKFTLQNGDRLIVYYAGANTLAANKIDFSTKQPNKPVTISINNYDSYSKKTNPVNNIKAKLDGKDVTLNGNQISITNGLTAGTHNLEVSDFKTEGMPNVIADNIQFSFNPTAHIRIEGLNGTIIEGNESAPTVLEMVKDILSKNNISIGITSSKYGDYLSGVGDLKASGANGWNFYVKNASKIITPDTGMAVYVPNDGDDVVLYYGNDTTPYVNNISFTPNVVKENEKFTVKFSFNHFDWTSNQNVTVPIKNAIVKIDDLAPLPTNDNGEIELSYGLINGQHTYKISGYNSGSISSVIMDKGTFTIDGVHSPSMNYSDGVYNNGVNDIDNTKIVKNMDSEIQSTLNFVKTTSSPWAAISLEKLGVKPDESFIRDSAEDIKANGVKDLYNTDLEKLIMGLAACGYNPYDFMGYDLPKELFDRDINSFYANDAIFGLMTYNYANIDGKYKITKDALIKLILKDKLSYKLGAIQIEGWTYYGNNMDPDLTGMALSALAPYYDSNPLVKSSVDNVVNSLSYMQTASGYIPGQYGISSESQSFVILGLTALGINPEGPQFTKAKGDLVSALLSFKGTNGQYLHSLGGKNDAMSTEEAFRALIALSEFKKLGKYNFYYSNNDSSKLKTYYQTNSEAAGENKGNVLPQTGSVIDDKVLIGLGALLIVLGIVSLSYKQRKVNN